MVIYLDVLFIENFIVNLFLLYITSQTLKVKSNVKNSVLAASLGAIYAVLSICTNFKYLYFIPIKLAIAALMVFVSFTKKEIIFNIKASIIFILYSMLLAGLCVFIEFNRQFNMEINFKGFSYKMLLCALMIIYIVIHRLVTYVDDRKKITQLIYDVEIVDDDLKKNVKAFLDTGNELREPATNLPVMIVERGIFDGVNIEDKDKFIIPYRVVNGFSANLEGFKPKMIKVHKKNETQCCKAIVALCDDELSSLNDYNALLSRGIF